jgi:hypothetical protein
MYLFQKNHKNIVIILLYMFDFQFKMAIFAIQ